MEYYWTLKSMAVILIARDKTPKYHTEWKKPETKSKKVKKKHTLYGDM